MELKQEVLDKVKCIYGTSELDLFNEGLNGKIYSSNGKLIKVTGWNERAFGPCDSLIVEKKLEYQNGLKNKRLIVPQIFTNPYGNLSTVIRYEDRPYIVYSQEKKDVVPPTNDFNYQWGKSLGMIHRVSEANNPFYHYQYEWENINKLCSDEKVKKIWDALLIETSLFEKTKNNYGLLHGDPQPNNFLPTENGMCTIDFDMIFNGFFAHDIAIGLQFKFADIKKYLETELSIEERNNIFNQFITGYCGGTKFDKSILIQIDTFLRYRRAMRFIALYKLLQKDKDNFEVVKEKVLRNERIL